MKTTLLTLALGLLPQAHSAPFSGGEPLIVWAKKPVTISVCWGSLPTHTASTLITNVAAIPRALLTHPSKEEKAAVKAVITREFTLKKTGIAFTGWADCKPKNEKSQVYLFSVSNDDEFTERLITPELPPIPEGQGSLGQNGVREEYANADGVPGAGYRSKNLTKKSYVFLKRYSYTLTHVNPTERLQMNALHEFGHLAGLRHEHVRPEAAQDPICKRVAEDLNTLEHTTPRHTVKHYSDYDPQSVMNYCYLHLQEMVTGFRFYRVRAGGTLGLGTVAPVVNANDVVLDDPLVRAETKLHADASEVKLRIGLSTRDQHALKCLYNVYTAAQKSKRCVPEYRPVPAAPPAI